MGDIFLLIGKFFYYLLCIPTLIGFWIVLGESITIPIDWKNFRFGLLLLFLFGTISYFLGKVVF